MPHLTPNLQDKWSEINLGSKYLVCFIKRWRFCISLNTMCSVTVWPLCSILWQAYYLPLLFWLAHPFWHPNHNITLHCTAFNLTTFVSESFFVSVFYVDTRVTTIFHRQGHTSFLFLAFFSTELPNSPFLVMLQYLKLNELKSKSIIKSAFSSLVCIHMLNVWSKMNFLLKIALYVPKVYRCIG